MPVFMFGQLEAVADLPKSVSESSGLAFDGKLLWTHNDNGNEDLLFGLDPKSGQVVRKIYTEGTYNKDWEDLAIGPAGQIFIGDLGNNDSSRKHLTIYWLPSTDSTNNGAELSKTTIEFQSEYTSKKAKIKYDIEALVLVKGKFYLFTKTKKNKFEDATQVFEVPAIPGKQLAVFCGSIKLCKKSKDCKITAAAYHAQSGRLALLSHQYVWLTKGFDPTALNSIQLKRYKFDKDSQKEGLCFYSTNVVYITEERVKGKQKLYRFTFE